MVWTLDYALMTLKIKLHYDKSKIYNSYVSSEKKKKNMYSFAVLLMTFFIGYLDSDIIILGYRSKELLRT